MSLESDIRQIIKDICPTSLEVYPTHLIIDDLGADSLDQIEIVMKLEDEFDIEISNEEAEKLKTVEDIVRLVKEKV